MGFVIGADEVVEAVVELTGAGLGVEFESGGGWGLSERQREGEEQQEDGQDRGLLSHGDRQEVNDVDVNAN